MEWEPMSAGQRHMRMRMIATLVGLALIAAVVGCGGSDLDEQAELRDEMTLDAALDCPPGQEMVAGFEEIDPDQATFSLPEEAADAKVKLLGYRTTDLRQVSPTSYSVVVDGQEVLIVRTAHVDDGWVVASYEEC